MPNKRQEKDNFHSEKALAEKALKNEQFDEALVHYRKALEFNPDFAEGDCNIGFILMNQGEFDKAETHLLQGLGKDDDNVEAYFNLGCLHQQKNEFEKALCFFKEVVTREPSNAPAFARMGECAQYLGRSDDAAIFFAESLRLQPDSLESATRLAALYINQQAYEDAEDVLRLSLISHSDVVSLYFTLGLVLKQQTKYESALAQFNRVVQMDENCAEGFYHLADCCVHLNLDKQAEPFFAKAFKLDQTFVEPVYELGKLYERMGKSDSAVLMYQHWVDMVEDIAWSTDERRIDAYKRVCEYMKKHHLQQGEAAEADIYRDKMESLGSGKSGTPESTSEVEVDDYRVSLQIDD